MPNGLRNALAIVAGIVSGSIVNMLLVYVGSKAIPAPEGVDPMDAESLRANIHLFEPKHFVFPFLAHALGTLDGAMIAGLLAKPRGGWPALAIGAWFLLGGIVVAFVVPAPPWFIVLDLVAAYLPMAWLGSRLARLRA